jgi:RNA polymerase sigma-70 factor (ECF subfamily)
LLLTFRFLVRHTDVNHDHETKARERLTRLWLEAEPSVQAFVFAAVNDPHDAEDVVQQVALTVARRLDEYDGARPFVAWALWLAKSRIADHFRRQGRERLVFSDTLMDQLAEVLVQRQPSRTARQEALERCLEKLPEKSRHLLALRYEEDAPMERVAESIESSAGAVRVMLFRVRNLLSDCIDHELTRTTP